MKFNKEKTKKFASGGKTPKEIQEAQARAISQDSQQTAAREIALDAQQTAAREIYLDSLRTAAREQGGLGRTRVVNEPEVNAKANVKPKTFNQAFAAARKAGLKEFT